MQENVEGAKAGLDTLSLHMWGVLSPFPLSPRRRRAASLRSRAASLRGLLFFFLFGAAASGAETFYLDAEKGVDGHDGLTPATAWASLERASARPWAAGDALRLHRGQVFPGTLRLDVRGTAEAPVTIEAYGVGASPRIDAAGFRAGLAFDAPTHLIVRDLAVTADGGTRRDGSDASLAYGVRIEGDGHHVMLERLLLHTIFPPEATSLDGRGPTTHRGVGISVAGDEGAPFRHLTIRDCTIERTGFHGIQLSRVREAQILDNLLTDIGGPGIQPSRVQDLLVRGNTVTRSGSSADPRMHGRGSGIWPWTAERVLIERNTFRHARGKADSCGIHIDFYCRDVVVQYNLSHDNEGGFIEILGDCHNSAYRYNLSINDGARVKGEDGAHQEGKVLWTSGYVGRERTKTGPFNSYLYNNTIYVGPGRRATFSVAPTTEGLLIANNIFHLMGPTENVLGDQDQRKDRKVERIARTDVRHNLYLHDALLPPGLPYTDAYPIFGDAQFARPGGTEPEDYRPGNVALVRDRGIAIPRLEGDPLGLRIGLEVTTDLLGQPIDGLPDLGAIELPGTPSAASEETDL